jgi:hypothetical protein
MIKNSKANVNFSAMDLAIACRKYTRAEYSQHSSCIETAYLFKACAFQLDSSLKVDLMVCQTTAFSPDFANLIRQGISPHDVSLDTPGVWSVGIGQLQSTDDFVGREDKSKNRYVGHVVCIAEGYIIDPSADQMNRPLKNLHISDPVIGLLDETDVCELVNENGCVIAYRLHPLVTPPFPKSNRKLDREAKKIALDFLKNK